jgi:hypothetical protein
VQNGVLVIKMWSSEKRIKHINVVKHFNTYKIEVSEGEERPICRWYDPILKRS